MTEQKWHVYYRTTGMAENAIPGWKRSDHIAESASDAIDMLIARKHNIMHAKAYPAAVAYVVNVAWVDPTITVTHLPHDPE